MKVLKELASARGRRDSMPNQILAQKLVETKDTKNIEVLVDHISNPDKAIARDCIRVIHEIGYLEPHLVERYVDKLLALLESDDEKIVWAAMNALSTIATYRANEIYKQIELVKKAMKKGSVATIDQGVSVLAEVASKDVRYNSKIFPLLLKYLKNCPSHNLAAYAEKIFVALSSRKKKEFFKILENRKKELTPAQLAQMAFLYKSNP